MIVVGLMTLFVMYETFHEHRKFRFGHAAALVMLIGIGMSALVFYFDLKTDKFSEAAVLDYAIPVIVFNDGYNMRKQRFFKEMANINMHGKIVTFAGFLLTYFGLYFLLSSE